MPVITMSGEQLELLAMLVVVVQWDDGPPGTAPFSYRTICRSDMPGAAPA